MEVDNRSTSRLQKLNLILNNSAMEEQTKRELLDDTSLLISSLPNDLVEKHIWPYIRERSTNFQEFSVEGVRSRLKDLIRMGSCNKRWNHLVQHTRFWAAIKLATKNIFDINEDLDSIPGAPLLSLDHVPSFFYDGLSGLPDISVLGAVDVSDLSRVKTYWRDLADDEKNNLVVMFSSE